jgi:hypothetical protein
MADSSTVTTYLNGLDEPEKRILTSVFDYVLKDIRFGRGTDQEASKNFGGGFFKAKTPSVANTEFTVAHTFGRTPYLVIPVLPLDQVNAKIVRLEVTKAADTNRIYLRSPDTDATVFLYIEG